MTTPIIILHRGNPFYLPYCLYQTRFTNPTAPLILLGDDTNRHYAVADHRFIREYGTRADSFAAVYEHLSSMPYDYELFCFQRWFILLELMRRHDFGRCIHLDSDVLPFTDLAADAARYPADALAMCHFIPHLTYIGSQDALARFCDYVTTGYTDPSRLGVLREQFAEFRAGRAPAGFAGVSDMTLFEQYCREDERRIVNLFYRPDSFIPDDNLNAASEFVLNRTQTGKQLHWRNGLPYATHAADNRPVRLKVLHCQGIAKTKMPWLATFPKAPLGTAYLRDLVRHSLPQYGREAYRHLRYH